MDTYDLDLLTSALPTITYRGKQYRMKGLSALSIARIQKAREILGSLEDTMADGRLKQEYRNAIKEIISATVEGFPMQHAFGEYRWWHFSRTPMDVRSLTTLLQAVFAEIGKMTIGDDDLKNVLRPVKAGRSS